MCCGAIVDGDSVVVVWAARVFGLVLDRDGVSGVGCEFFSFWGLGRGRRGC